MGWSHTRGHEGSFGNYSYINFCAPFFEIPSLEEKIQQVNLKLHYGDLMYAEQADLLENSGMHFLHELMHHPFIGQPEGMYFK